MFKKIAPKELKENPFSLIGDKWMLITAGTEERCNTMHRRHKGYGGNVYENNSGRNDIVGAKVARDADNVYFYVETADNSVSLLLVKLVGLFNTFYFFIILYIKHKNSSF